MRQAVQALEAEAKRLEEAAACMKTMPLQASAEEAADTAAVVAVAGLILLMEEMEVQAEHQALRPQAQEVLAELLAQAVREA